MGDFKFWYDQGACIGCNACQMACKDKNHIEMGKFYRRVDTVLVEEDGNAKWMHVSEGCRHCETPACVQACRLGAMVKKEDGTVLVDREKCVGCGSCAKVCQFGAVFVDKNRKAAKCDGCLEERKNGKEPACVQACITHCLKIVDAQKAVTLPENSHSFAGKSSISEETLESKERGRIIDETVKPYFPINERKVLVTRPVKSNVGSSRENGLFELKEGVYALLLFGENFFTGREQAIEELVTTELATTELATADLTIEESETAGLHPVTEEEKRAAALAYDYLFRGTDASFVAPLWASMADGEKILLNEVTLEVIRTYHKFGYEPEWIEGNPPDYIGEQIRFLRYLWETADKNTGCVEEMETTKVLLERYIIPNMRQLHIAVGEYLEKRNLKSQKGQIDQEEQKIQKEQLNQEEQKIQKEQLNQEEQKIQKEQNSQEDQLELSIDRWLVRYEAALSKIESIFQDSERLIKELIKQDISKDNSFTERYTAIVDEEPHVIQTAGLNNCGGICVIRPTVAENCMLKIESDCNPNHAPQIRACVRGRGYRKTFLSPGRLKYPMKRVGKRGSGKFERISWEEAVEIIAAQWKRITQNYGPSSRYVLYGTGVEGIMRPGKQMERLLSLDGGFLDFFNSYSSACVNYISKYIFGTASAGNSPRDLLNTKLLILWADNTAESIFGPERNYYLAKVKEMGIRIIAIDPRMSQTAVTYADEWFALKPSTDAALADAMAYVIWSEGLQDQQFMDTYCIGFDEAHMPEGISGKESYHSYLFGLQDGIVKTPEWAEKITGIEADRIRSLAREYATTKPACISTGLGAQRHGNGEQSARGISMLACLTGNVGIPGGGAACNISMIHDRNTIGNELGKIENPYPGRIPTFLWTKAIEHGKEMTAAKDRLRGGSSLDSDIKMIFCLASDILINQHSNINDTVRILQDESKCEFILCSDVFMTPSAKFADLVLPATSIFEGENISPSWAGGNYLVKNNQVLRPFFDCRFEWEWMKELAKKLGHYDAFVDGRPLVSQWLRDNYEIFRKKEPGLPDYDTFSKEGGYQFEDEKNTVAFEEQIRDFKNHPFETPSGKIEIFSKALYDLKEKDVPAIPKYLATSEGPEDPLREKYPLQLIGWHTRRRCHSIHDNNEWMDEVEKPGVWIHPKDARERGIQHQDEVLVFNDRGTIRISAIVTNRICEGVVAISQGGWYTPDEKGVDTRGSINVLTSSKPTPLAKGNPQHTNLVEVRKNPS